MEFVKYIPVWDKLTNAEQEKLVKAAQFKKVSKGTVLHSGSDDCLGLLLIRTGQLRAYVTSEEGREVTIYRLFDMDVCLLSASCMMQNIQFQITIEAEKASQVWIIPTGTFKEVMESSAAMANYANQLLASRFSEAMWLMEQIMWKSFDERLADFLLIESILEQSSNLRITHEKIANHMGTAREVVTRMLKYFQSEGMVRLGRGVIEILDFGKLEDLLE